jgi:hypothetical protein
MSRAIDYSSSIVLELDFPVSIFDSRLPVTGSLKKRGAPLRSSVLQKLYGPRTCSLSFLLTRRLDVYIYLLRATASKQPSSKRKEHYQNDDHEDHQYCDNSCAAATTTIISHEILLL